MMSMANSSYDELIPRHTELSIFNRHTLPPCFQIDSQFPFYSSHDNSYMSTVRKGTGEAILVQILRKESLIYNIIKFEKHDNMFDYEYEVALNFIERRDGSIHSSISQAINIVYDIHYYGEGDTNKSSHEHVLLSNGMYKMELTTLSLNKTQGTTISLVATILIILIIIVSSISALVIFIIRLNISSYDLSSRVTIANIVRNSYRSDVSNNEFSDINIAINQNTEFDHLGIHNNLISTGRRKGYELIGI